MQAMRSTKEFVEDSAMRNFFQKRAISGNFGFGRVFVSGLSSAMGSPRRSITITVPSDAS